MTDLTDAIDEGLEAFTALVREDPDLSAELESSVRAFFGGPPPAGDARETLLAARRHLEWFVLERHSPSLFGTPVERLLDAWRVRVAGGAAACETALLDSFCSVFRVGDVRRSGSTGETGGAWLQDLAGFGSYALAAPDAALAEGDLLVGRLFPVQGGVHVTSVGAGIFRGDALGRALEYDLSRAREDAGRNVLRLGQRDLETMFWGAGRAPVPEDPVAAARKLLARAGLEPARIERALEHLRRHPCDPGSLVLGAGDALGEVLDELAFETRIDLEGARRALALAWPELSAPREGATPSTGAAAGAHPGESDTADARAAVEAFARGRAAGGALEPLLADLRRGLDLPPEDDDEEEEDADEDADDEAARSPTPDFPGVVGAMVEEFLWETACQEGPEAGRAHACLRPLGDFGARMGVFEELDATELLRFTTFWLLERGALGGADEARALLRALAAFCAWAESAHELPLATQFGATLDALRESLPRIVELNRLLDDPPADQTGELYEVRADARGRYAGLRDRQGRDHTAAPEHGLEARLRGGDRLRGAISLEGRLTVFRCYPPQAAGLSSA